MPKNLLRPVNPRQHNPAPKRKKVTHHFEVKDFYYWEAKRNGFRARSAFKLLEIQEKFNLIKLGMNILDIGSAPGSFLQVIHSIIKDTGKIVGVDIQKIEPIGYPNLTLFQHDVFETESLMEKIRTVGIEQFDLMTSDIAPSTTGMPGVDQYRSVELNLAIMNVADVYLKKWGNLVLKVFIGEDVQDLVWPIKQCYRELKRFKPRACRDRSFEEYFICVGKK